MSHQCVKALNEYSRLQLNLQDRLQVGSVESIDVTKGHLPILRWVKVWRCSGEICFVDSSSSSKDGHSCACIRFGVDLRRYFGMEFTFLKVSAPVREPSPPHMTR